MKSFLYIIWNSIGIYVVNRVVKIVVVVFIIMSSEFFEESI